MGGFVAWRDIRAEYVEEAGGEEAIEAGKQQLLVEVRQHREMTEEWVDERPSRDGDVGGRW